MREWFNMTELAEKTNIPDTTCRRYITKFPDFFMYKGGTRSRRYEDSSIKILIRIKNLFDSGYETEEVDLTLRKEFPTVVDGDRVEKESTNLVMPTVEDMAEIKQSQKEQAEMMKLFMEEMKGQREEIKQLGEKLDLTKMELLRANMEERKALIETAAVKEPEKKSFFARLFGK